MIDTRVRGEIDRRVLAVRDEYAGEQASAAWLLCDRHPAEALAITLLDEDLSGGGPASGPPTPLRVERR